MNPQADLQAWRNRAEALEAIVRDFHWLARRYVDGRCSYVTGMFNDRTRSLLVWGVELHQPDETPWARDGQGPAYCGLTAEDFALGKPFEKWQKTSYSEEYTQLRQVNQVLMKLAAKHYPAECIACQNGEPCGHLALLAELEKLQSGFVKEADNAD